MQAVLWKQLICIMVATNACVWAQDIEKGRIEFLSKCAECHGSDGKGAGRLGRELKIKPADLTGLAKRNNGVFLPEFVAERESTVEAPHTEAPQCRSGDAGRDLHRVSKESA